MFKSVLPRKILTRFFMAFCIFLVALLLCAVPIINRNAQKMEKANLQIYTDTLNHNLNLVNNQLQALQAQLLNWGKSNEGFQKFCESEGETDYITLRSLHSALQEMITDYTYAQDVVLLTRNNYIITRHQTVVDRLKLLDPFFQHTLIIPEVNSPETFRKLAEKGIECLPVSSAVYGRYNALLLFQTIWYGNVHPAATAMIAVDVERILSAIAPDGLLEASSVQIFWKEQPVYETGALSPDAAHMTLHAQGSTPGISVTISVPRAMLNAGVYDTIQTMWVLVLAALLGGLALALFFMLRMGRPMRTLVQKARKLAPSLSSNDEYDYLSKTLEQLDSSLKQRSKELDSQRRILQNSFLEKALLGNLTSQGTKKDFQALFPHFPQRYHLALLHLPTINNVPSEYTVNVVLSRQLMVDELLAKQFAVELYHFNITPNLIALILPDELNGPASMESFQAAFQKEFQLPLNIYLSQSENGAEGLSEAYAHAKRIQRLAAGYIEKRVWSLGNFPQQEWASNTDYSVFQHLYEAINLGETETAVRCLRQIQFNLNDQSSAEEAISAQPFRRTLHFLHSILIRVKQEHFSELSVMQLPPPDLDQPLAAYFSKLEEYTVMLSDALNKTPRQRTAFGEDIVAYVDQHFTDPELYQKTVADYFHLSEKTLQSAVRSVTQMSFAEYLEKKRLDLAHQLLIKTELSVKDISQQAGFALYNTFYKAFKRRWDCSPTEYQLQYRGAQPPKES